VAQISVTISGKNYRIACEDGQELYLEELSKKLDETITHLRNTFGAIGEQRLVVMAALMAMDETTEMSVKLADANAGLMQLYQSYAEIAERVHAAADKIEHLSGVLELQVKD